MQAINAELTRSLRDLDGVNNAPANVLNRLQNYNQDKKKLTSFNNSNKPNIPQSELGLNPSK